MRISQTLLLATVAVTGATVLSAAPASASPGFVGRLAELRSTSPESGANTGILVEKDRHISSAEVASDAPVAAVESSSRSSFIDRIVNLSSTSPE